MSVVTLNNNTVYSIINAARAQALGGGSEEAIASLDLKDIVDAGGDETVIGSREAFAKALINVLVKNWFTDTSYRSSYSDPFFEDSARFGAITQMISVEVPAPRPSAPIRYTFRSSIPSITESPTAGRSRSPSPATSGTPHLRTRTSSAVSCPTFS